MTTTRPDRSDPLYDPAFLIFVYSAWAVTAFTIGHFVGIVVLVLATAAFSFVALRQPHRAGERLFITDFGVVLLFCAAAIGLGVLIVAGFTIAPEWMFAALMLCALGGLGGLVRARMRRDNLAESA